MSGNTAVADQSIGSMTDAEIEAEAKRLEKIVARHEDDKTKKWEKAVNTYGPGTKFNRNIVMEDGIMYDEGAKKWFVNQRCRISGVVFKTYTSDLFQKDLCPAEAAKAKAEKRKGAKSGKAGVQAAKDAQTRLDALKASLNKKS